MQQVDKHVVSNEIINSRDSKIVPVHFQKALLSSPAATKSTPWCRSQRLVAFEGIRVDATTLYSSLNNHEGNSSLVVFKVF